MRKRARHLYPFDELKDSITRGKSNIYGATGEIIFGDTFPLYELKGTADYDFIHTETGETVDVKTKRTTARPRDNWNCSVAAFNTRQRCDYYYFIRVLEDGTKAWLLGWLPKEEFFQVAQYREKGEEDPEKKGWHFTADCYNVRIDQLRDPRLDVTID